MATSTDRQHYREMVAEVAERAKAMLPTQVNGRIEGAVKHVLQGDVEPQEDGSIRVNSSSDPTRYYVLQGTSCTCTDYVQHKAPEGWCRHRIAAGIAKRVTEMMPHEPATEQICSVQPSVPAVPLPEAPASVNVHLTISGRQVQLTLRDSDEGRLLARLETVLQRFPLPSMSSTEQGEGWCGKHHVPMQQTQKNGRAWYSHRTPDGWCKGR